MTGRRPDGPRPRTAFLGSVALHAAVIGALAFGSLGAKPAKRVRVYRVDIVSPAPNVRGEPLAEPPAAAEPGPAPAETPPAREPQPAPAQKPPAPEPPAPEPVKAPAPQHEEPKAPERPRERPTPPRPDRTETPPRPETPRREPATPPRANSGSRPGGERTGTGAGPDRTAGTGTRPGPATGRNPDANSPGGEGLNVRTRGVACPENYCNNVVRQVRRFFRAPDGTQGASANVCFTLFRDGSVDDVAVERQRGGGFQFRLALVEAVEQAGLQHAFGALPRGFEAESIQLCVLMSPATT